MLKGFPQYVENTPWNCGKLAIQAGFPRFQQGFDAKEKGDKSIGNVLYYICIIIESCQKAVRAAIRGKMAAKRRRTGLYPIVLRSNHIADGK